MDSVVWSDKYSVGIQKFDNQHKILLEKINELDQIHKKREDFRKIEPVIENLIEYAKTHFVEEEEFMKGFQYDRYTEHRMLHLDFIRKITEFHIRFKQQDKKILSEMLFFLQRWLLQHILIEDKKYSDYMKID